MFSTELLTTLFLLLKLTLSKLKEFLGHTQSDIVKNMGVVQSALSKIEHQDDIQISMLSRYMKFIDRNLTIIAYFRDHEVIISQFD